MDENHDRHGDRPNHAAAGSRGSDRPRRKRRIGLRCRTTEYPDRPDRCTVYPPELGGVPRMSTWISLDRVAVLDLERMR